MQYMRGTYAVFSKNTGKRKPKRLFLLLCRTWPNKLERTPRSGFDVLVWNALAIA